MQYSLDNDKQNNGHNFCINANGDFAQVLLSAKMYSNSGNVHVYVDVDSIGREFTHEQIATLNKIPNVCIIARKHSSHEYIDEETLLLEKMGLIHIDDGVQCTDYATSIDVGSAKKRYFKQAVCIRAYDDFPLLMLMTNIYKDYFKVYVLIDADSIGKSFTHEQLEKLKKIKNVYVCDKYIMPKNSYNEVLALLEISEKAFSDKHIEYLHMVTGMDMPIVPMDKLYSYYEQYSDGRCFLNCHADGDRDEMKNVAAYTYRYYHYFYNDDDSIKHIKEMVDDSFQKQKQQGVRRDTIGEFTQMYKGVFGGSISRAAYIYFKEYIEHHPEYLEDIKYTRLRTEFLFHTVLLNSEQFSDKIKLSARGSKMDWSWDNKNKDYRKLDKSSYEKLKSNPESFFLRKVTSDNPEVVKMILKDLKTPYKIS